MLNPRPTPLCLKWIGHEDDITVVKTWKEVLDILRKEFPGAARVGTIQDATMQYLKK